MPASPSAKPTNAMARRRQRHSDPSARDRPFDGFKFEARREDDMDRRRITAGEWTNQLIKLRAAGKRGNPAGSFPEKWPNARGRLSAQVTTIASPRVTISVCSN